MRTRAVLLVVAAAALAPVPAAHGATRRCDRLHGHDLVRNPLVKVVHAGHRYLACTKPSGRVRRLPGRRLELLDSRGGMLAVRDARTRAVTVWDVASGARHRLRHAGRNPVGHVLVTETGAAAGIVGTAARTTVAGFDVDGTSYALDSGAIPRSSLRHLAGERVRWARPGGTRSADLAAPAVPCASLHGRRVARTAQLNVVSISYPSEFLEGALDGRTVRVRGCALDGGGVRTLGESTFGTDGVQGGSGYTVVATAGTSVLGRSETSDSQGDYTPVTLVREDLARGGRRLVLWGNADARGPHDDLGDLEGTPVLTGAGQAAGVFSDEGGTARVVGFASGGAPQVLDSGPLADLDPSSLALEGTVLRWTHAGQPRAADLAALG